MRKNYQLKLVVMMFVFLSMMVGVSFAVEAVVEKETVPGVVITEEIVKTADNFIILFDSSSSMKAPFKDTGLTTLDAAKKLLKDRNAILPDLGYNAGLYLFTPFKPIYMMQKYDRDKFAAAIDQLPEKASGATLMQQGLLKLDGVLSGLSGRTVVFLFTDGMYSRMPGSKKPVEIARGLAEKYNVCFYVISTAKGDLEKDVLKAVASISECSRVVPFDQVFEKPVYVAGALFIIETRVEKFLTTIYRLVDIRVDNILFDFDSTQVRSEYNEKLSIMGEFLKNNPSTYVVLTGFTDSVGPSEYNLGLARRRAESIEAYLIDKLNVSIGQVVTQWYGKANPVASNDSNDGRQQNRRVEAIVMGFD
ncbi:MAG: OmpA family protein [Deltaproteobacteria bacterium]|jgi:OOP family OmpA-OmpF porin|nr:OmpA family protein [Deltaproteobacteria bacterium]